MKNLKKLNKKYSFYNRNKKSFKILKKEVKEVILFDYFTFDNFNPFKRVDFFSFVVNFRC